MSRTPATACSVAYPIARQTPVFLTHWNCLAVNTRSTYDCVDPNATLFPSATNALTDGVQELRAAHRASSNKLLLCVSLLTDGTTAHGRQFHQVLRPRSLDASPSQKAHAFRRSRIDSDPDECHGMYLNLSTKCCDSAQRFESIALSPHTRSISLSQSTLACSLLLALTEFRRFILRSFY